jgi:hypothetical protein
MKTKQIPKDEWSAFLDMFTRQHQGWLVKLEILDPEIGAQVEETGLTLEGVTDDWNQTSGHAITIMAGRDADKHITHSIKLPTQISLEQTDDGADVALSINSGEGTTALLSFRATALPETVDGVAAFV